MPDYEFKGSYPMVYPAEIGAGFEVTPAEGNPKAGAVGSTVYLYPLDTLHTTDPIPFHAWLEPAEGSEFADAQEDEPTEVVEEVVPPAITPPKASKATIAANAPEVIIPAETIADSPVLPVETTTDPVPPVDPAPAGDEPKEEQK